MKIIKYILFFSLFLILSGIVGKTMTLFPGASAILMFGFLILLLFGMIYGIIALVKSQHRQEAAMIAVSMILMTGILFKFMHWPGASVMIIVGSPILMFGSIGIAAYSISKKIKASQSLLFLSIGMSSLFFCFKLMRWPGSTTLFLLGAIVMIVAIIFLIKQKEKINIAKSTLLVVIILIVLLFKTNESDVYKFGHISTLNPSYNHPEHLYTYSSILSKEGMDEAASYYLEEAIKQLNNPDNFHLNKLYDSPENSLRRYQKAKELLESGNWSEFEESPYNK
ncbi:MAG: hypothetical protein AB8B61_07695 [Cyclobacteriaceae bacterium]